MPSHTSIHRLTAPERWGRIVVAAGLVVVGFAGVRTLLDVTDSPEPGLALIFSPLYPTA